MDENPSAFPYVVTPDAQFVHEGMTLRDYFAGQALAAFIDDMPLCTNWAACAAGNAYELADAMLTARLAPTPAASKQEG